VLLNKPVAASTLKAAISQLTLTDRASPRGTQPPQHTQLVCVVEDNPDIRDTILSVLEGEEWPVIGYPSAEAFLAAEETPRDRCLIIDTSLPGMSGIALIEHLRAKGDTAPAILITGTGDIAMAVQAMRSGASDFIERPVSRRDLIESIERAVSPSSASLKQPGASGEFAQRIASLTQRQQAVLAMVMAGEPSKNIAADLGISQRTVESHRAHIMHKLGVRTIPDLVRAVLAAGSA
jgi:two-component system CheB/CheR fusion protein